MTAHYYFDSSALAKHYVAEVGTGWVEGILARRAGNAVYTVRITGAEVVAGLFLRSRIGTLSPRDTEVAAARFKVDFRHHFRFVAVSAELVETAMLLAERHALRGYDAVQLAAALVVARLLAETPLPPLTFVCADTRLNTAAQAEGLIVENPNDHG